MSLSGSQVSAHSASLVTWPSDPGSFFKIETEQQSKSAMTNQHPETQIEGFRGQSQQAGSQIKWNLFIGDEPYGFVHATSEAEALDRVRAFKRPFRAVPAPEE